jgi:hypothetical protein
MSFLTGFEWAPPANEKHLHTISLLEFKIKNLEAIQSQRSPDSDPEYMNRGFQINGLKRKLLLQTEYKKFLDCGERLVYLRTEFASQHLIDLAAKLTRDGKVADEEGNTLEVVTCNLYNEAIIRYSIVKQGIEQFKNLYRYDIKE